MFVLLGVLTFAGTANATETLERRGYHTAEEAVVAILRAFSTANMRGLAEMSDSYTLAYFDCLRELALHAPRDFLFGQKEGAPSDSYSVFTILLLRANYRPSELQQMSLVDLAFAALDFDLGTGVWEDTAEALRPYRWTLLQETTSVLHQWQLSVTIDRKQGLAHIDATGSEMPLWENISLRQEDGGRWFASLRALVSFYVFISTKAPPWPGTPPLTQEQREAGWLREIDDFPLWRRSSDVREPMISDSGVRETPTCFRFSPDFVRAWGGEIP